MGAAAMARGSRASERAASLLVAAGRSDRVERAPAQRSPKPFRPRLELLGEPGVERATVERLGLRLRQHLEAQVHARLDGPLVQEVVAEAVDRADARLLEMRDGVLEPPAPRAASAARSRSSSSPARSRSFSSPAAFSVNVSAAIVCTVPRPSAKTLTRRATSSLVLPVPAAASTTSVSSSDVRMRSRSAWSTSALTASPSARAARRSAPAPSA